MRWLLALVLAGCAADAVDREPALLSDEGLYRDIGAKTIAADAVSFAPTYHLWSDGAEKQRWLRLPPGTAIDTSDMDHWRVPVGTTLFKEFTVGGRRIETRVIERRAADDYRFRIYVWLPDESDAIPAPDGAVDVHGTGHDVPGVDACMTCHQSEPGVTLGVSALQLSGDGPLNLVELGHRGLLSDPPTHPIGIPGDATTRAALGTLHANCGHCHSEGGVAPMQHLRFLASQSELPVEATDPVATTVGVATTTWHDDAHPLRIAPGDPEGSAIVYRMSERANAAQMPPLGTAVVDATGVDAVRTWVSGLPPVK